MERFILEPSVFANVQYTHTPTMLYLAYRHYLKVVKNHSTRRFGRQDNTLLFILVANFFFFFLFG